MHYTALSQRSLLMISGEEQIGFLQGLLSNDVRPVQGGNPVYAALLTPQGKFLHDVFLLPWHGDALLIDTGAAKSASLLQRLNLYKLRAKVRISALPETFGIVAAWGEELPASGIALPEHCALMPDPRCAALGYRLAGELSALQAYCTRQGWQPASEEQAEQLRLHEGVPDGCRDLIENKTLLLEAGFEELHGVDFAKGCYVGQEVTARSKHRGQVRKSFYTVTAASILPPSGTPVMLGEAAIGELRSALGCIGLAILNNDAAQPLLNSGYVLNALGVPLAIALPRYRQTIIAT